MTSLISSLKRDVSTTRGQQSCITPRSIANSPSFSDFSLGAEMEAEHALWRGNSRKAINPTGDAANGPSTWASMFGSSAPRDIPQAQEASTSQNASPTIAQSVPRRRSEGRWGYGNDYHDLIRSSSLS